MLVSHILREKGRDIVAISPESTLYDAANVLTRNRIGALLVQDGRGGLAGILSERDIVRALAAAGVAERDPIGLAYYTDAAELVAAGPYTPLILGPGDPGMAHQVDESVSIDALIRCADAYEAIGRELLG